MPGSILYRWSNGYFKPTFHSVEIRRGDPPKFTIVAFLNFPDHMPIPRSVHDHQSGSFLNEVQRFKEDDMNTAGDLVPLWTALNEIQPTRARTPGQQEHAADGVARRRCMPGTLAQHRAATDNSAISIYRKETYS